MSKKISSVLLTVFVVITILVNALANILPFNGQTTKVVSDKYFTFFTPAGFTFAIWGVIYIGWIAIVAYSWMKIPKNMTEKMRAVIPWFILNCIANMVWLLLWHYEFLVLSVLVMLLLLVSLLRIYWLLGVGVEAVDKRTKWLLHVPISIYLGWISVATIANIASTLVQLQLNTSGTSDQIWSVIMLIVAGLLGIVMLKQRNDFAFALVIVWATVGIASNFSSSSRLVSISALAVSGVLIISMAVKYFHSLKIPGFNKKA